MIPNYLPPMIGIALHKGEFCFCTGLTPYQLRKLCQQHAAQLARRGYHTHDKVIMPQAVLYLLDVTGLQIDMNLYYQITGASRVQA